MAVNERREFLKAVGVFLVTASCNPEKLFGTRKSKPITPDFFGHMIQAEWVLDDGGLCCPVSVYFGLLRLWDSRAVWRKMETDPTALDANLRYAERVGADAMFVFGEPPASALLSGKSGMPTKDAWVSFVKEIASKHVRYVELWNEPAEGYWDGTPEELADYCKTAYPILSATGKTVLSPSITLTPHGIAFAERFLNAGGSEWCDEIAFHAYADSPVSLTSDIATLRALLDKHGVTKPIRNTEYNLGPFNPAWIAQSLVIQASLGVQGAVYNPEPSESANDYTDDTMARVAGLLLGSTVGPVATAGNLSRCVVSRDGVNTELAWAADGFPAVQMKAAA